MNEHDMKYDYQERDTYIPAPFDKYYEIAALNDFNDDALAEDEIPEAFNNYSELTVLAKVYAKERYEDALSDNCLDCVWLICDEVGKLLLVTTANDRVYPLTLEEVTECVGLTEADTREPSSVEYGDFMSSYYRELTDTIEKYGIRKIGRKRSIEYDGVVNGHKFYFVEANTGTGHYAKELYIDGREVNLYQSKESERSFAYLNEMNQFGILSLVKMLENDNLAGIIYRDVDTLDDYEESLVEDVEMSDAQRLALQELDSCLEYGELNAEQHALAYQIQWDINFEDVLLFVNGIDIPLQDIKHVEYGDCSKEYDGCYNVTLHDGTTKQYGWHDWDATASLTCIDCNESLTESDDGWDKPYSWTQMYQKDGFLISDNYDGTFHLEQTSPKRKHLGNYKTLEAAKAAGDAEINKRNTKNANKPVQFGVHSFTSDSIVFRGTEEECAEYINKNGLENEAEIYMMTANDSHYLEESATKKFNNGDRVYVTVSNRQGTVTKMISDDVVEVEFEANGTYPARIDRFYTSEVELIDMTPDLEDVTEQYWAVFAKDRTTGKEYCSGVYGSERDAYYWAGMERASDAEYHYGNFDYRVERVSDYTDDLDKSKRELDTLKLFNHSTHKENDIDDEF